VSELNTQLYLRNQNSNLIFSIKNLWYIIGLEAFIWICGLFYLIVFNTPETTHFTICPISNLGFDFCPGCGLGNSISYLFKGNIEASFLSHPLGIFAFIIIVMRIISLIKINRRRLCQMYYN